MDIKKITVIACSVIVFLLAIACIIFKVMFKRENPVRPDITTSVINTNGYIDMKAETRLFTNAEEFDEFYKEYKYMETSRFSDAYDATEFDNYNYIAIIKRINSCGESVDSITTELKDNSINLYYDMTSLCGVCALEDYVVLKKVNKKITTAKAYYKYVSEDRCDIYTEKKPLIYIYPEEDIDLTIKLGNSELLTHTYPKYKDSWNVHVTKDGNIYDYDTKRNYYGLYWEATDNTNIDLSEGFVVEGKDTIKLLEDKLAVLGLNEREINEFIIYWIDSLENNKYNYVHFRTTEEVNKYMPLEFSKDPDTLIRVLVDFVPLDEYKEVKEQRLEPVTRTGYTVVEWGANIRNK